MTLKRILLADDLTPMLTAVTELLHGSFDIVGTAANGQTALDAVLQLRPDLAVLDISMPGKNGLEVARELKSQASPTKIVFLSVHEDTDIVAACFSAGASGYVVKALMDSDLIPALNDALAGRVFVSHLSSPPNMIGRKQFMSCIFDFDLTNKIIRCRLDGIVTDETLKEYYRFCSKYGALNPTYAGIFDMSNVTFIAVSAETIRELAMQPPAIPDPDILRVIVAGSSQMFRLARMFDFQGSETRPNLHVVRTEKDAFAILRVTDARFAGVP
jgi:CheY-like chemotaxis protein